MENYTILFVGQDIPYFLLIYLLVKFFRLVMLEILNFSKVLLILLYFPLVSLQSIFSYF